MLPIEEQCKDSIVTFHILHDRVVLRGALGWIILDAAAIDGSNNIRDITTPSILNPSLRL